MSKTDALGYLCALWLLFAAAGAGWEYGSKAGHRLWWSL